MLLIQGEGTTDEQEISFEFHRQRFCFDQKTRCFEKLKYPTRVQTSIRALHHVCCRLSFVNSYKTCIVMLLHGQSAAILILSIMCCGCILSHLADGLAVMSILSGNTL